MDNNIQTNKSLQLKILLFLCGLSPLLYYPSLHNPSDAPKYLVFGVVASLLIIYGAYTYVYKSFDRLLINRSLGLLFVFVVVSALSLAWSYHFDSSLNSLVFLLCLLVVYICVLQVFDLESYLLLIKVSVVSASIAALIGVLQNWGLDLPGVRYLFTMGSTFNFKTHATLYFDLILPISIILLLLLQSQRERLFYMIAAGLILGYQLESHARGAWLALAMAVAAFVVFLLTSRLLRQAIKGRIKPSAVFLLGAVLIGFVLFSIPGKVEKRWEVKTEKNLVLDESSQVRLVNYRNALSLYSDNPVLGVGYGAFWKPFREYTNRPYLNPNSYEHNYMFRLHNDWLQIFVELGVLGGGIFLLFIFSACMPGLREIYRGGSEVRLLLSLGLMLSLVASFSHAIVDFPFKKPSSALQIFIWLAILSSFGVSNAVSLNKSGRFFRVGVFVVLIVVAAIVASFYYKNLLSNSYFYKAEMALSNNDCDRALTMIDKAGETFGLYLPQHFNRVYMHLQCEKDKEKLFNVLSQELVWNDTSITALLARGDLYLSIGLIDKGIRDYDRVIEILPHRPLAYYKKTLALLQSGKVEAAKKLLQKIIREHPDYVNAKELYNQLLKT